MVRAAEEEVLGILDDAGAAVGAPSGGRLPQDVEEPAEQWAAACPELRYQPLLFPGEMDWGVFTLGFIPSRLVQSPTGRPRVARPRFLQTPEV